MPLLGELGPGETSGRRRICHQEGSPGGVCGRREVGDGTALQQVAHVLFPVSGSICHPVTQGLLLWG